MDPLDYITAESCYNRPHLAKHLDKVRKWPLYKKHRAVSQDVKKLSDILENITTFYNKHFGTLNTVWLQSTVFFIGRVHCALWKQLLRAKQVTV